MVDELSLSVNLSFSKGGVKVPLQHFSCKATVDGDAYASGVQEIGTVEEEVAQLADLGTPGWVLIINLDSTNYVEVGALTGEYTNLIEAGKFAFYQHDKNESSTILAKATGSAVKIQYFIFED